MKKTGGERVEDDSLHVIEQNELIKQIYSDHLFD